MSTRNVLGGGIVMRRLCTLAALLGLFGCGANVDLGQADASPTVPGNAGKLQSFAAMSWGMCGVFEGGTTYCWGRLGSTRAERAANLDGIALGSRTAGLLVCAVRADGSLGCAPDTETGLQTQLGVDDAVDLSVGQEEWCTLSRDGTIRHRFTEQCPDDGDLRAIHLPSPAIEVRCADRGCCAATEDGRLFCAAGRGTVCDDSFDEVPGITDAVGVSMTMEGACVLHAGGTVSCTSSQLDPETFLPDLTRFEPVSVSDIVQLRSSRIATCGLALDGRLRCWGRSSCGSLGISEGCSSTEVPTPIVVQQDIQARLFGMGDGYNCALDANDDVWCWGFSAWTGSAQGSPLPRRIEF